MINTLRRFITFLDLSAEIPEVKVRVSKSLIASLSPYQMIQVNPDKIEFFEHGIKLDEKSSSLFEAYNSDASTPNTISLHGSHSITSITPKISWKVQKSYFLLGTSGLKIQEQPDEFLIDGEGKFLVLTDHLIELEEETIYIPKLNLIGHDDQITLIQGNIGKRLYWKASGSGQLLIKHQNTQLNSNDSLETFTTDSTTSEGVLDQIFRTDDFLASSPFKSFSFKFIPKSFGSPSSDEADISSPSLALS